MDRRLFRPLLPLAALAVFAGCSADAATDDSEESLDPIVEPTAHVVDAEPGPDMQVNADSLVFPEPLRADVAGAAQGDVLVSGHGAGFLRRIKSTRHENGKVIVSTEPGALTDVFQQAHLKGPTQTGVSSIAPQSFSVPLPVLSIGGIRLPVGGEGSDITIEEGSYQLKPEVDYDFVVKDRHIDRMKLVVSAPTISKLKVKYHIARPAYVGNGATARFGEPGKKIAEAPPHYVLLWVGYVPVVIVVKVELLVGYLLEVGGEVSGETSFESDGSISAGVSYDGQWHNESSSSLTTKVDGAPTFQSLTLGGDVTLTAKLSVSLYDVVGPWVELQGYAGVGRDSGKAATLGDADIYAEFGLRGLVGVEAAPFGTFVAGYQSVVFDKGIHVPIVRSR